MNKEWELLFIFLSEGWIIEFGAFIQGDSLYIITMDTHALIKGEPLNIGTMDTHTLIQGL